MHKPLRLTALAALIPSLLICAVLPGMAADNNADDNARILAGIEPRADSPLAGLTRRGWVATARKKLRCGVGKVGGAPAVQDPHLVCEEHNQASADHALYVQRT